MKSKDNRIGSCCLRGVNAIGRGYERVAEEKVGKVQLLLLQDNWKISIQS